MRRSKLILTVMTLLLLFASFLSVPALSGENPWDADGGNGGDSGSPLDSAQIDAANVFKSSGNFLPESPNDGENEISWISGIMMRMSNFIVERYYKWTSHKAQIKTAY